MTRTISEARYGGFILTFEPERTELIEEILFVDREASDSFSVRDWKFQKIELIALAKREPELSIFGFALMRRMKGRGGTGKKLMRFYEPVLFSSAVGASEAPNGEGLAQAISTPENMMRIVAPAWREFVELIKGLRPEAASSITELVRRRGEDRPEPIAGQKAARLNEQRDALGLCLDIAELDRRGIFKAIQPKALERAGVKDILDVLDAQPVSERTLLERDARIFELILGDDFRSARFVGRRGREVRAYVSDMTPIETATGVDLFIYQQRYESFLLLQYKAMEYSENWSYKVDGSNLDAQLLAMERLRSALPLGRQPTRLIDQRLYDEPFYFKFCERVRLDANDDSLSPGITMSAPHLTHFLSLPEAREVGANRSVGYQNCPRYLSNTEFVSLARGGWLGCSSAAADAVGHVLSARDAGRAMIFAVIQSLSELSASDRGRPR
jgi:hypothetical protein